MASTRSRAVPVSCVLLLTAALTGAPNHARAQTGPGGVLFASDSASVGSGALVVGDVAVGCEDVDLQQGYLYGAAHSLVVGPNGVVTGNAAAGAISSCAPIGGWVRADGAASGTDCTPISACVPAPWPAFPASPAPAPADVHGADSPHEPVLHGEELVQGRYTSAPLAAEFILEAEPSGYALFRFASLTVSGTLTFTGPTLLVVDGPFVVEPGARVLSAEGNTADALASIIVALPEESAPPTSPATPATIEVGANAIVSARLHAHDGTIRVGTDAAVIGQLAARWVDLQPGAALLYPGAACGTDPETTAAACHDGDPCTTDTCSAGACVHTTDLSCDTTPPTWPSGSVAEVTFGGGGAALSWTPAVDDTGVTGYQVSLNGSVQATPSTTTASISGAQPGDALAVRAVDGAGLTSPWLAAAPIGGATITATPWFVGLGSSGDELPGPVWRASTGGPIEALVTWAAGDAALGHADGAATPNPLATPPTWHLQRIRYGLSGAPVADAGGATTLASSAASFQATERVRAGSLWSVVGDADGVVDFAGADAPAGVMGPAAWAAQWDSNTDLQYAAWFDGAGQSHGAAAASGALWVAGRFASQVRAWGTGWEQAGTPLHVNQTGGAGAPDGFVARLDPTGAVEWLVPIASMGPISIVGLAADPSGDAYVLGSHYAQTTFGQVGGAPAQHAALGQSGAFVARYAPDGQLVGVARLGDPNWFFPEALTRTRTGSLLVSGWSAGTATWHSPALVSTAVPGGVPGATDFLTLIVDPGLETVVGDIRPADPPTLWTAGADARVVPDDRGGFLFAVTGLRTGELVTGMARYADGAREWATRLSGVGAGPLAAPPSLWPSAGVGVSVLGGYDAAASFGPALPDSPEAAPVGSDAFLAQLDPDTIPPTWPVGTEVTAQTLGSSVLVTWSAPADDDRGPLAYSVHLDGDLSPAAIVYETTAAVVTGVGSGVSHTLRVDAIDAWSQRAVGPETSFFADFVPPTWTGEPAVVASTPCTLTAGWSGVLTDDVAVDRLDVYVDGAPAAMALPGTATTVRLSGLVAGSEHLVSVYAWDAAGNVDYASPWLTNPLDPAELCDAIDNDCDGETDEGFADIDQNGVPECLDVLAPTWPAGAQVVAVVDGGDPFLYHLSWTPAEDDQPPNDSGVATYDVLERHRTRGTATWTAWGVLSAGVASTSTSAALASSMEYELKVEAVDLAGNASSDGPVTTLETLDVTPPTWSGGAWLTALAPTSVTVAWVGAADDVGVVLYQVSIDAAVPDEQVVPPGAQATLVGLAAETAYTITVAAIDQDGNEASQEVQFTTPSIGAAAPPQAPPLDLTVASTVHAQTEFLHTPAATALQVGVTAVFESLRTSAVSGRALDMQGSVLPEVTVRVLDHDEYGWTETRTDGRYDLVVEGGQSLVLVFEKGGYLPAQRRVEPAWNRWEVLEDVVLVSTVADLPTEIAPDSLVVQTHVGRVVTDADGSRQANLIFLPGTAVAEEDPVLGPQPLTAPFHVRTVEYTVGDLGPNAMPGALPPTSAYTYAVEAMVDELPDARVSFDPPARLYVDNFLEFYTHVDLDDEGTTRRYPNYVPLGYYNHGTGLWEAMANGYLLTVLGEDLSGLALIDVNEDGVPDYDYDYDGFLDVDLDADGVADSDTDGDGLVEIVTADGVPASIPGRQALPDAELEALWSLYEVRVGGSGPVSLMRMELPHFSPFDGNWPSSGPQGGGPPPPPLPPGGSGSGSGGPGGPGAPGPGSGEPGGASSPDEDDCEEEGSIIAVRNRALGERVHLAGTPYELRYSSLRTFARADQYGFTVQLHDGAPPADLMAIVLRVTVAGEVEELTFEPDPVDGWSTVPAIWDYYWDGHNAFGEAVQGTQAAKVELGYTYPVLYQVPQWYQASFGLPPAATADEIAALMPVAPASEPRRGETFWTPQQVSLGGWSARAHGLGGWGVDVLHSYDVSGGTVLLGTGRVQRPGGLVTTAYGGEPDPGGSGVGCLLGGAHGALTIVSADGGGFYYLSDQTLTRVHPDGSMTVLLDLDDATDMAPAPGGGVFAVVKGDLELSGVSAWYVIRIEEPSEAQILAGSSLGGPFVDGMDGGQLGFDPGGAGGVGVDATGAALFAVPGRIVRRGEDGRLWSFAGTGALGATGDGGLAVEALVTHPVDFATGANGDIYFADSKANRVRRIGFDGVIETVVGTGDEGWSGVGGPAVEAELVEVAGIHLAGDGSLFISDPADSALDPATNQELETGRVLQVTPDGLLHHIAGDFGHRFPGVEESNGDGGAVGTALMDNRGLTLGGDGALYVVDALEARCAAIRRLDLQQGAPAAPDGGYAFESRDGGEVFVFDEEGRHLETRSAVTGAVRLSFDYDPTTRALTAITDAQGLETTLDHSVPGVVTVTGPGGHAATMNLDAAGYLESVVDPTGATTAMEYDSGGLLTRFTLPGNDPATQGSVFEYDALGRLEMDWRPERGWKSLVVPAGDGSGAYEVVRTTAEGAETTFRVETLPDGTRVDTVTGQDGQARSLSRPLGGGSLLTLPDGTVHELGEPEVVTTDTTESVTSTRAVIAADGHRVEVNVQEETATADPSDAGAWTQRTMTTTTRALAPGDPDPVLLRERTWVQHLDRYDPADPLGTYRLATTSPAGRTAEAWFDADGRLLRQHAPGVDPVTLSWSGALLTGVQAGDPTTELRTLDLVYKTDGSLQLDAITAAAGSAVPMTTTYDSYDDAGRPLGVTLPGPRSLDLTYDLRGNLQTLLPPGQAETETHEFEWSARDELKTYTPPAVAEGETPTSYVYDDDGRITSVGSPDGGTLAVTYHSYATEQDAGYTAACGGSFVPAGRPWRVTWPGGGLVETCYDELGRSVAVTGADATASYQYGDDRLLVRARYTVDDLDGVVSPAVGLWLDSLVGHPLIGYEVIRGEGAATVTFGGVRYGYDGDDLVTSVGFDADADLVADADKTLTITRDATSGAMAGTDVGGLNTTVLGRDGFGGTTSWEASWAPAGGEAGLWTRAYAYDPLGRVASIDETPLAGGTTGWAYAYDTAGRLDTVTEDGVPTRDYAYDDNGNRVALVDHVSGVTWHGFPDVQDRLLAWGPDGGDPESALNTQFTYSATGHLALRAEPDGAGGWLETTYEYDGMGSLLDVVLPDGTNLRYRYDHRGRRVARLVYVAGQIDPAETRIYVYQDQLEPVAELDGNGDLIAQYAYGAREHVPDLMWDGQKLYRLLSDHLGSVRYVVDVASGAVVQALRYDEYGVVLEDTEPGFQPFGFAGGLHDPLTGLVRFGARDYDAEIGRWTAKDPIGFAGGDTLLYGYVGADPVNLLDPTGLLWCQGCGKGAGSSALNPLSALNAIIQALALLASGLHDDVHDMRAFDLYKHCYLSCTMSQVSGDPGAAELIGKNQEGGPAALGALLDDALPPPPANDPYGISDADMYANACGRSVPADDSCVERCQEMFPSLWSQAGDHDKPWTLLP